MSALSSRTQALLAASRPARNPSPQQLDRVRHSLVAKIAAGAGVAAFGATAGAAGATAGASASGLGLGAKLVVASALALGGLGGAHFASSPDSPIVAPASSTRPTASGAARVVLPAELPPPAASVAAPHAVRPAAPPQRAASTSEQRAPQPDTLLEEARLLGEVQQALGAGQVTRALAGLREYDAKFPRGSLRVEAEAARVLASCQSGSSDAGRAAAERFSKRYPGSPAVSRVRRACSEPVR